MPVMRICMKRETSTERDEWLQGAIVKKSDVARQYKVSRRTVEYWMKQRIIPFIKVGGCVRFDKDKVEEAIRRFTSQPNI